MLDNIEVHPLSLKIEGPAGLFYLTSNKLHASMKTNRLMLYRGVSTVVISYKTHVLYSVRAKRRVFNLRFDVPVVFSVADIFFQLHTTYKTRCNRQHLQCVIKR